MYGVYNSNQQYPANILSDSWKSFSAYERVSQFLNVKFGITYAENPAGILMQLIGHGKLGMNPTDTPDASVAANVLNGFISRANKSIKSRGGERVANPSPGT